MPLECSHLEALQCFIWPLKAYQQAKKYIQDTIQHEYLVSPKIRAGTWTQ